MRDEQLRWQEAIQDIPPGTLVPLLVTADVPKVCVQIRSFVSWEVVARGRGVCHEDVVKGVLIV